MIDPKDITIEFPCRYPIKVIGEHSDSFVRDVFEVVRKFDEELSPDEVTLRKSKMGRYESVRITITATGEVQLKELHEALKKVAGVRLVL